MSPAPGAGRTDVETKDAREPANGAAHPPARKAAGRSPVARFAALLLTLLGVAVFIALGIWQLERRVWKLDLIARVEARVHAPAVDTPGSQSWSGINADGYEYRHVRLAGSSTGNADTLVQAVTELGGGYWVLTPVRTDRGFVVMVNRGFIPLERKAEFQARKPVESVPVVVEGLLRMSEPGGGFLRRNDPAGDRWYSRDVAAIAAARGLGEVAPYFIDAGASGPGEWPRGGLTVVHFRNTHLVYALTWFSLAAMLAAVLAFRGRRRTEPEE